MSNETKVKPEVVKIYLEKINQNLWGDCAYVWVKKLTRWDGQSLLDEEFNIHRRTRCPIIVQNFETYEILPCPNYIDILNSLPRKLGDQVELVIDFDKKEIYYENIKKRKRAIVSDLYSFQSGFIIEDLLKLMDWVINYYGPNYIITDHGKK